MHEPYVAILLMYGSHDMRHTGLRRLTVVNKTLGNLGRHKNSLNNGGSLVPQFINFSSQDLYRIFFVC